MQRRISRMWMRRTFAAAACAGVLIGALATGCSPAGAKVKAEGKNAGKGVTGATGMAWNWESYPPLARMRIGQLPCQLQPKSTITVVSPISGLLRIYVTAPQSQQKAGFLWGEFEPEILKQDELMLAEALKKLEDLERVNWELEIPRKRRQLEQQIKDAEREFRRVEYLSNNPELARKALAAGASTNVMRPETLEIARETYELLQRQMKFLEETNSAAIGFDLTSQRTEWKRRELELQRRKQNSRFEMPFDGTLTVGIPISGGVTNYPVNQGQELAVARDVSAVRARVVIENAAWTSISPDRLRLVVTTGGRSLEARFAFQKIEKVQNREESAYYFEFPREKSTEAARLIGANNQCELWVELSEPARIVPKMAVILHQPDAFQNGNWSAAIATTFPGARLLLEGQADLALIVPESEVAKSREVKLTSAK